MSYADTILPEFDQEMASTRKVLERIPDDKLEWKAHPKSRTIGWNANHLVELPGWVEGTLTHSSFDVAPVDGEPYETPRLASRKAILEVFDQNVASARKALKSVSDAAMKENWSLLQGGKPLMTMPRSAVIRSFVLNHCIHHRAHLCVYLRLNDIPVPGMYGPSGDEPPM
ncbi:MAG: DinB family protein [Planctomycetaceae bacterium]|nr:DinB family protein [Planctomycetaceae bacterium]